jgi:probable rRNA maturation factor
VISFEVNQQAGRSIDPRLWRESLAHISRAARVKKSALVSIAIVDGPTMRRLNRQYRQQDKITDVLSFAEADQADKKFIDPRQYLGEVVLCYSQVQQQARRRGIEFKTELNRLFVHGVLHLLGYDHQRPNDAGRMEALEAKILGR